MKRRLLITALVIALTAALVGGGTMAWFSYKGIGAEAVFAAGTVIVDGDFLEPVDFEGTVKNVNPGDCYCLEFEIENKGSKAVELRVTGTGTWEFDWVYLEENWEGLCFTTQYDTLEEFKEAWVGKEPVMGSEENPVFINSCPESNWVFYAEIIGENEVSYYWYYLGGAVPGTHAVELGEAIDADRTVKLCLCVAFDGELMNNWFQGAEFTLNGTVEAVQASNDAPEMWNPAWDAVNDVNYTPFHPYFDGFDFSKCKDLEGNPAACCQQSIL